MTFPTHIATRPAVFVAFALLLVIGVEFVFLTQFDGNDFGIALSELHGAVDSLLPDLLNDPFRIKPKRFVLRLVEVSAEEPVRAHAVNVDGLNGNVPSTYSW